MTRPQTPSQTVGPYFSMALADANRLVAGDHPDRIRLEGRVLDADGEPVEDAIVEVWQANAAGRYRHPDDTRDLPLDEAFTGFGRCGTDFTTGTFWFDTVKPGPVPDPEDESQAPHLVVVVQARGLLNPLFTRCYFGDEPEANDRDWVLHHVPADRRHTLIAEPVAGSTPPTYRLDIRLAGDGETVFFDV